MTPALSHEQWADGGIYAVTRAEPRRVMYTVEARRGLLEIKSGCGGASAAGQPRHAIAALALHEQDFGFTWEDVDLLMGEANIMDMVTLPLLRSRGDTEHGGMVARKRNALVDLAGRISALLPPHPRAVAPYTPSSL